MSFVVYFKDLNVVSKFVPSTYMHCAVFVVYLLVPFVHIPAQVDFWTNPAFSHVFQFIYSSVHYNYCIIMSARRLVRL
jgi:hypothetical protein